MKTAFWFIAGFLLGAVATFVFLYGCHLSRVPVRIFPPMAIVPRSVSLDVGKMILAKTKDGTALIKITSYGEVGSESTYRWRFRSRAGVETKGSGILTEVDDKGTPVVAGGVKLGWSWGSNKNCWLYYFDRDVTIQLLPDKTFDSEELK